MRMPYQRMITGPTWKAMAPGEVMTKASTAGRIARGCQGSVDRDGWRVGFLAKGQEAVQVRNVRTPRDRNHDTTGAPGTQADQFARPHEEPQDIVRMVLERVGGIVSASDDSPMTAPVRFDASADELDGVLLDDAALPPLERDRSLVLAARAVLREQRGPGVRVRIDNYHGLTAPQPNRVAGA